MSGTDETGHDKRKARASSAGPPRRNFRLTLEYEGRRFDGWQDRPNCRSVAGTLLEFLRAGLDEDVKLSAGARTGVGVHAEGQVASFNSRTTLPISVLAAKLAEQLPADLGLADACEVPLSFHAQHSAVSRSFRYQLATRRSPFSRWRTWLIREELDRAAMEEATRRLVGQHDFKAFTDQRFVRGKSTVLTVFSAAWHSEPGRFCLNITADHVLPRMVRRLVGALVAVGLGQLEVKDFSALLDGSGPDPNIQEAPASGLFLTRIDYPEDKPRDGGPTSDTARRALEALESSGA